MLRDQLILAIPQMTLMFLVGVSSRQDRLRRPNTLAHQLFMALGLT